MTIREAVIVFNAKKSGRGKYLARCPAHPDKNASLAIAEGKVGILVKCMSHGCDTKDVLAAVGLGYRDLFYMQRDATSEQMKAIFRQRRLDALYAHEQLRQDFRMVYRAMKHPPEIMLYTHIQNQFSRKIEEAIARQRDAALPPLPPKPVRTPQPPVPSLPEGITSSTGGASGPSAAHPGAG